MTRPEVRTGDWISKAWQLVTRGNNLWMFVVVTLIVLAVSLILGQLGSMIAGQPAYPGPRAKLDPAEFFRLFLPSFGVQMLINTLIIGPLTSLLTAGAYAISLHLIDTGKMDLGKLAVPFQHFWQIFLAGLLIGLFSTIAALFCVIPFFFVQALYLFPLFLIMDRKLSFWDAMEESRRTAQQNWLGFVGFFFALVGVSLLGLLACCIGLLVASPVVWVAIALAYRELWPRPADTLLSQSPASPVQTI